ncbi:MAG: hypothetical protein HZC52_07660 [Planctomycetes bacterium]|nr:hypothetical protein [Planctomycetota bacterium]
MSFLTSDYGKQVATFKMFTMSKSMHGVGINGVDNKRQLKYYFDKKRQGRCLRRLALL